MSTKMSNDLNVTRPTSRVLRAPGGGSSFSIAEGSTDAPAANRGRGGHGGESTFSFSNDNAPTGNVANTPAKKPAPYGARSSMDSWNDAPPAPAASAKVAPPAPPAPVAAVKKSPVVGKVGVIIGGDLATDAITAAIAKALVAEGISGSVMTSAPELTTLVFATKKLASQVDTVIVAAIVADSTLAPTLQSALTQLSLSTDVPIIPGLVVRESLLEAKALLSTNAAAWAKAAASVLSLKNGKIKVEPVPEPVIAPPAVITPVMEDPNALMNVLKESLNSHGARGIAGISRKFRIADDDNSGKIDFKEFVKVISEHALNWSAKQVRIVFDHFDSDRSGAIDFDEFIFGIRGQLNDRRRQLVLMAFEILDSDHSGVVELNDISAKYNADKHPDVLAGRRSKDDVLREFLDTFDTIDKDGRVTTAEFIKYYGNCSSSIDDDDYFELMIRNAWHISGGEGWCANSSCRRVLVGHSDGSQTVEEIKNDLGIGADDRQKMVDRLIEQGVSDIEYIESSDGVKFRPNGAAPGTPTRRSADFADSPSKPSNLAATGNRRRHGGGGASTLQLF
eukprot:CAMPEP_0184975600 /NCGR_PEP_ID=MMETSP1098-20130426/6811_1 /TAXON_ID=89044 /ORGANISM="Spumella elongata, Strain CCAP 955/1" /LENGTH=563 /DNA_ID=CAMNT_0027498359 /DNA_START=44 /DNA_END=1735 /DNA_ORIENTATION=+